MQFAFHHTSKAFHTLMPTRILNPLSSLVPGPSLLFKTTICPKTINASLHKIQTSCSKIAHDIIITTRQVLQSLWETDRSVGVNHSRPRPSPTSRIKSNKSFLVGLQDGKYESSTKQKVLLLRVQDHGLAMSHDYLSHHSSH